MLHESTGGAGKTFVTIAAGSLRIQVPEDAPGAVKREYETSNGAKGVKFERVFESMSGIISRVEFQDSDFGKNCHITIGEDTLSIGTDSRFFQSFGNVFRNIKLDEPVMIKPYDFQDENDKKVAGLTITQNGEKVARAYWDGKKTLHGAPEMEEKNPDSDDWKMFFTKQKKFFIKEIETLAGGFPEFTEEQKEEKPVKKK